MITTWIGLDKSSRIKETILKASLPEVDNFPVRSQKIFAASIPSSQKVHLGMHIPFSEGGNV